MSLKYMESGLLGMLPNELTTEDRRPRVNTPMSEVASEANGLTPEIRRKKIALANSKSSNRIIRKGHSI